MERGCGNSWESDILVGGVYLDIANVVYISEDCV